MAENITEAVNTSLDILDHINFDGIYYRTDIGYEFKAPTSEEES
jgi:phosphoribosylamine-glycine ligase